MHQETNSVHSQVPTLDTRQRIYDYLTLDGLESKPYDRINCDCSSHPRLSMFKSLDVDHNYLFDLW